MIDLVTLVGTSLPRAVSRWYPDIAFRLPTSEQVAYLTFDDGPNPVLTERIVDILDRHEASATFFLIGSRAARHPSVVRLLMDAGHAIGNHTFSHADAWKVDTPTTDLELAKGTRVLEDLTGSPVRWMRPPYGHFTRSMRHWCRTHDQRMTMWDVGTGDFLDSVDHDHVVRHVEAYVRSGSVIVLHDNPCCADTTPTALDRLLRRLRRAGWRFAPLPTSTLMH